ncbi:MAG: MBL fold metallo-hydrolase [Chitinophagaceae bacterium]|nr:MBL fold metallo-hydrolase [Chitinophagaceae bacterium]
MRIYPLSEGSFSIDETKVFKPFDSSSPDYPNRPKGSILVEVQPFVIITDNDIILLDTGLGYLNKLGVLQIHENLMALGIDPSTITKVFLSHLHKDHAGGISYLHPLNQEQFISFPYAKYYVQKREFEDVMQNSNNPTLRAQVGILEDFSGTVWLTEDKGNIDNLIHYEITGAHCKYHQVAWIKENKEIIFFGADVAPQIQQMKSRFVAKYDLDGKKALEYRQHWWEEGNKEGWTFAFYHDISQPTYKTAGQI